MLLRIFSPRSLRLTVVALFLLPPAAYWLTRGGAVRTASAQTTPNNFRNFESPQVHPLALTPDGARLLAVNSPNATLSVFQLSSGTPVLTAEMLQSTGQYQPRFLLSAGAIHARDLLRQRLLDQLLERAALPCRDGFCFAEEWPRNFECRFHKATVSPIFMGASKPRRRSRVKHRSASRVLLSLIRGEAIFFETLSIFFLCKGAMNTMNGRI